MWVGISAFVAGDLHRKRWREHRLRILSVAPMGTPEVSVGAKDRDPGLR